MFDALHMSRSLSGEMFALLVTAVACLVALPLMVWRLSGIWRRSPREVSDTDRCLASLTRGTRNFGLVSIAIFWGIFGLWGGLAPLSSAALAPGIVSPDGNRKTVQHLEGGIVRTIDVAEGDVVTAGQVIVRLEDVAARAALVELTERLAFLLAEQARLVAEQSGATSIQFPDEMADFGETGDIAKATQAGLFATRLDTTRERHSILATRVLQLQEQNMGLAAVVDAQHEHDRLVGSERDPSDRHDVRSSVGRARGDEHHGFGILPEKRLLDVRRLLHVFGLMGCRSRRPRGTAPGCPPGAGSRRPSPDPLFAR